MKKLKVCLPFIVIVGIFIILGLSSPVEADSPDPAISPASAVLDLNSINGGYYADYVPVTISLNGHTLTGIKNGSSALAENTDYVYSIAADTETVQIKQSYLDGLYSDPHRGGGSLAVTLTFNFSGVTSKTMDIAVVNTRYLSSPQDVAVDRDGNVYMASYEEGCIFEMAKKDGVQRGVAMKAGKLYYLAMVTNPYCVEVDKDGNIYGFCEYYSASIPGRAFEIPAASGTQKGRSMTAGTLYYLAGTEYNTNTQVALAVDQSDNLYITDAYNNVIKRVDAGTGAVSTVATGSVTLSEPRGVFADKSGNLFVADSGNQVIRRVATTGAIATFAGNGSSVYAGDGTNAASTGFGYIRSITGDDNDNVYFSSASGSGIVIYEIPAADGAQWGVDMKAGCIYTVTNSIENPYMIGVDSSLTPFYCGMAIDTSGSGGLYIANQSTSPILAGTYVDWRIFNKAQGAAASFLFDSNPDTTNYTDIAITMDPDFGPLKLVADITGGKTTGLLTAGLATDLTADTHYYVTGNKVYLKKSYLSSLNEGRYTFLIDYHTHISTVINVTVRRTNYSISAVTVDKDGNVYSSNTLGDVCEKPAADGVQWGIDMRAGKEYLIYKITETKGSDLCWAGDMTSDDDGNLYLASTSYGKRVYELAKQNGTKWGIAMEAGKCYTIAGGGTSTAAGIKASLNLIEILNGIALDGSGDLYIASYIRNDDRYAIRKVDPATGLASIVSAGVSFHSPQDLAFDKDGYLYVYDQETTTADNKLFKVDLAQSTASSITTGMYMKGLIADADGNIYFIDSQSIKGLAAKDSNLWGAAVSAGGISTIRSDLYAPRDLGLDKFENLYLGYGYDWMFIKRPSISTTLSAILGNSVTVSGSHSGSSADPYSASVTVGASTASILPGNLTPADAGAAAELYTNSAFTATTSAISITSDTKIVYIGVTAEDKLTKNYYAVTVNRATDAEKVAADKAALNIGYAPGDNANSVTQNLSLPGTGATYGSTITWASNNTSVISTSGAVTRPAYASGDADVTLTATINCSGTGDTKIFSLKVLKLALTTYSIASISDQTMAALTSGYASGTQETRAITITRNGTGDIAGLAAALSGTGASSFAITSPSATSLNAGTPSTTFTIKAKDGLTAGTYTATVTISAANMTNVTFNVTQVVKNQSSSGDHSGSSGGTTPPPGTNTKTITSGNTVTATTITKAADDGSGKATASVTQAQVSDVVKKAVEEAAKQGTGTAAVAEIKVEAAANAKTVETGLPKSAVDVVAASNADALTVSTPIAAITFDSKALDTIAGTAAADIKISAAKVDASTLSEDTKQLVGDRPVYNFNVTSGNDTISEFGGNVTVSVPYAPKAGEDTNAIVIYYINSNGKSEAVPNCKYDPATKTVIFTTNHFSKYAVGYNKVSFSDVKDGAWYKNAVDFAAARGIVTGTGNGNYSPDGKLTRAQLLVMLMRAYGIEPDTDLSGNFSDAGNSYYTGYLAAAKRLGITEGLGNNQYAPHKQITRQEMFTLLYNTLKVIGQLPEGIGKTSGALTGYNDADSVASWAKNAAGTLADAGIVGGSNGNLSPKNTTTRAEMAQVLYNLLKK